MLGCWLSLFWSPSDYGSRKRILVFQVARYLGICPTPTPPPLPPPSTKQQIRIRGRHDICKERNIADDNWEEISGLRPPVLFFILLCSQCPFYLWSLSSPLQGPTHCHHLWEAFWECPLQPLSSVLLFYNQCCICSLALETPVTAARALLPPGLSLSSSA